MSEDATYLEAYLQWLNLERGRSRATVDAYRRDIIRLIDWASGQSLVAATLEASEVESYTNHLRSLGLAESSISRAVASIRGWYGFLVGEQVIEVDPSARLRPGRRGRSLPKPLSEADVSALIDTVARDTPVDLRDRALLELLYGTGARVSEAVGVSLQDLDFDEELILVTGKGSKQRLVPMGRRLVTALREYLGPGGRSEFPSPRRESRLFLNLRGGPLSRQGVDLIIDKRALAAGVDRSRVSAHVLRHSCATHMLAHGADIRVVQELLGHASISTTQVYTAVAVTSLKDEYRNAHPRATD